MRLPAALTISVGALGSVMLGEGTYAYVGSALGPGGIAARVARHLRPAKLLRWHIDYLTARAPVKHAFGCVSEDRLECTWARALIALPGASAPVAGFGAGDCRNGCPAHLIRLPDALPLDRLIELLCPIPDTVQIFTDIA